MHFNISYVILIENLMINSMNYVQSFNRDLIYNEIITRQTLLNKNMKGLYIARHVVSCVNLCIIQWEIMKKLRIIKVKIF